MLKITISQYIELSLSHGSDESVKPSWCQFPGRTLLSIRCKSYLTNSLFTCPSTLLYSSTSCVVVATNKNGTMDPLTVLTSLSTRNGFSRCSGRMFVMEKVTEGLLAFMKKHLPTGSIVRLRMHANPKVLFSRHTYLTLLMLVKCSKECKF